MRRMKWLAGVAAVVMLIGAPAGAAIKVTTITPLVSDICGLCQAPQVRLPITVEGLPADKQLSVAVKLVSLGNKQDSVYRAGVKPSIVAVEGGLELQVSVAPGALREQGTYVVALEFSAPGEPIVATTLQLVRAPAALQPPGTLIVERVLATPWSEPGGVGPPLALLEMSQRTGLVDVKVVGPSPQANERVHFTGQLTACPEQPPNEDTNASGLQLPPGQVRCLQYSTKGNFPWGSQVQSYSLRASELAAPVPVTFDVRTRLSRIYVLIYVLLGSAIGFLVKIKLQQDIDRRQAVALALALEQEVATDLERHQDSLFRSALADFLAKLQKGRAAGNVEAIVAARTALESERRTALADLAARRTTAAQLFDRVQTIVETQWQLPAGPLQAIAALRLTVASIRGFLARDAVNEAAESMKAALKETRDHLSSSLVEWQDGTIDLFDRVVASPVGLSPGTGAVATTAVAEARMRIGATQLSPTASADEVIAALSAASNEWRSARKVARVIGLALDQETDRVAAILGRTREALPKVVTAVEQVKQAILDGIDRPDRGATLARLALEALGKAWRETFEGIGGAALPAAVTDPLDQQRFGEAAIALVTFLRGEADSASLVRRNVVPAVAADDPAAPIQMFATTPRPEDRLAPIQALLARTQREIAIAKLFQTMVVLLLACIIGYGLFAPKFIGDYQDLVIIFFWAFALDLSVDAVTRLAPTARR